MKKITLVFCAIIVSAIANAQCISTSQWPFDPIISANDGSIQEVETCNYGGEYCVIDGTVIGNDYEFTTVDDFGTPNYITITDASDNVIASGNSPLTVIGITASSIRCHVSVTSACDTDTECHTTTIQCISSTCTPPPPPANDNFGSAIAVTCGSNYAGDTTLATLDEDSAPDGFGADLNSRNVWYSFTGSGTAQTVTLDLCGSSYDSSVLVYTGTSGNLTLVAANDDDGSCSFGTRSKVNFNSDGTTTYYITIEGYDTFSYGAYTMNVTCAGVNPPAVSNQDCGTALAVNVDGIAVNSDNSYGTVNASQPTCDLFGSIQDVWFSFVAPTSGSVDCTVTNGTNTSSNFAVYQGSCGSLTEVPFSCTSDIAPNDSTSMTGLVGGTTYFVQVWSNAAEQGTFSLALAEPTAGTGSFDMISLKAYPNPIKDILTLSYAREISSVAVYNMIGQEVFSKTLNASQSQLDLSNLTSGNYIVKVTADGMTKSIKVVKQ